MNGKVIGAVVVVIIILIAVVFLGKSFFSSHPLIGNSPSSLPINSGISSCKASDLNTVASWQGATGALVGAVQFTNKAAKACNITFNDAFDVKIIDNSGQVLETQENDANQCHKVENALVCPPSGVVLLNPKQQVSLPLEWTNWCKGNPKGALSLKITLSVNNQLTVPLTGMSGAPLSDTPRCDDNSSPSILSIKQFTAQ